MTRQKVREQAFLLIFERVALGERNEFSLDNILAAAGEQAGYLKNIYDTVDDRLAFLERHIQKYAHKFKLERIYRVDLSLMLLAMAEILFFDDVPDLVAVNEAIELAKRYSGEKSQKFIHGILANIVSDKERLLYLLDNPKEDVDDGAGCRVQGAENDELRITNNENVGAVIDRQQSADDKTKTGGKIWRAK